MVAPCRRWGAKPSMHAAACRSPRPLWTGLPRPRGPGRPGVASGLAAIPGGVSPSPGQQQPGLPWDYKYARQPCSSPCSPDDGRCLRLEALFQAVLGQPRLPPRVAAALPRLSAPLPAMTALVEALERQHGRELAAALLLRWPYLLELSMQQVEAREEALCQLLGLRNRQDPGLVAVLRKCPRLLSLEPPALRARYEALPALRLPFDRQGLLRLVRKYPPCLAVEPAGLQARVSALRRMAAKRQAWQDSMANLSPSLAAFFMADATDLLLRLEFLAQTGRAPQAGFYEVFKPSNLLFERKHPGFKEFRSLRKWELKEHAAAQRQEQLDSASGGTS